MRATETRLTVTEATRQPNCLPFAGKRARRSRSAGSMEMLRMGALATQLKGVCPVLYTARASCLPLADSRRVVRRGQVSLQRKAGARKQNACGRRCNSLQLARDSAQDGLTLLEQL